MLNGASLMPSMSTTSIGLVTLAPSTYSIPPAIPFRLIPSCATRHMHKNQVTALITPTRTNQPKAAPQRPKRFDKPYYQKTTNRPKYLESRPDNNEVSPRPHETPYDISRETIIEMSAAKESTAVTKTFGAGKRVVPAVAQRASKWYPAEDLPVPKKVRLMLDYVGLSRGL